MSAWDAENTGEMKYVRVEEFLSMAVGSNTGDYLTTSI